MLLVNPKIRQSFSVGKSCLITFSRAFAHLLAFYVQVSLSRWHTNVVSYHTRSFCIYRLKAYCGDLIANCVVCLQKSLGNQNRQSHAHGPNCKSSCRQVSPWPKFVVYRQAHLAFRVGHYPAMNNQIIFSRLSYERNVFDSRSLNKLKPQC